MRTEAWFIVHTKTGQEEKIRDFLESQGDLTENSISRIIVPTEEVAEIIRGKKRTKLQRFLPGYILVNMGNDEETHHLVRSASGVLGILGGKFSPTPLREEEAEDILKVIEEKKSKPAPHIKLEKGDSVEVVEGAFANLSGIVEDINPEKEKVKVSLSIFGRSTLVELEYWQVEKT